MDLGRQPQTSQWYAMTSRSAFVLIAALAAAVLAVAAVSLSTTLGLGLREDSFSYVTAAESLVAGTGLGRWAADGTFRPLTHFPPLFPFGLSLLRAIGLELFSSSRILNGVLFALTAVLTGILTRHLQATIGFSLFSGAFVLLSPLLIDVFSWLQSEPLYLALTLLTLLALGACLSRPSAARPLWAAGIAASLAVLTRYAGVSLVFLGIALLLATGRGDRRKTARRVLLFSVLAMAPSVAVAFANSVSYGGFLDRPPPAWHPPTAEALTAAAASVLGWVIPDRVVAMLPAAAAAFSGVALLIVLGIGTLALYRVLRRREDPSARSASRWTLLLLGHFLSYTLVIGLTVLFLDRLTPLNDRILSPLYLTGIPVVAAWLSLLWTTQRRPAIRALLVVLIVAFGIVQVYRSARFVESARVNGLGLSAREWILSPTLAFVRAQTDRPLYSNNLPALYFHTGRNAAFLPSSWNAASVESRSDFAGALAVMREDLVCRGGLVVVVGSDPGNRIPSVDRAEILEGLSLLAEFDDGLVYAAPPAACDPGASGD